MASLITATPTSADAPTLAADYSRIELDGRLRSPSRPPFHLVLDCPEHTATGSRLPHELRGGPLGRNAPCRVTTLALRVSGLDVHIPTTAYHDLIDAIPNTVSITTQGTAMVIHIKGGDGEDAYEARLIIIGSRLASRELESLDRRGELRVTVSRY